MKSQEQEWDFPENKPRGARPGLHFSMTYDGNAQSHPRKLSPADIFLKGLWWMFKIALAIVASTLVIGSVWLIGVVVKGG
jgi:hypothetical protein